MSQDTETCGVYVNHDCGTYIKFHLLLRIWCHRFHYRSDEDLGSCFKHLLVYLFHELTKGVVNVSLSISESDFFLNFVILQICS